MGWRQDADERARERQARQLLDAAQVKDDERVRKEAREARERAQNS